MKLPTRAMPYEVGKRIGHSVYFHKHYIHLIPIAHYAEFYLPFNFKYTLVKYNEDTKNTTFIICDDFDTNHEPIMGEAILINVNGDTKHIKPPKDPWIYHHKWLMVTPDYTGFNVNESIDRSLSWINLDIDKSRIGKKSYWEINVIPLLKG